MARADLIINLIKSGLDKDEAMVHKYASALQQDEAANQRINVANRIGDLLKARSAPKMPGRINGAKQPPPGVRGAIAEFIPEKTFDDLILDQAIHQQVKDIVAEHDKRALLAEYNLQPRHKLVFYGPPGNGKTSLAEAFASALAVPMFVVRYEDLIHSHLGQTAKNLSRVFDYVNDQPSVLFLDEFEAISKERGDDRDLGEIKRIVSSLLTQIDRLPAHVVLIGATNHSGLVDMAFWRRFQLHIELSKPNQEMISAWLDGYTQKLGLPFGYSSTQLADELDGASFSEVESFALDVTRQYVLSLPHDETSLKTMVDLCLPDWRQRLSS